LRRCTIVLAANSAGLLCNGNSGCSKTKSNSENLAAINVFVHPIVHNRFKLKKWNTKAHPFGWSEKSILKVIAKCQISDSNSTSQIDLAIAA
jgi:hypothetical protein